MEIWNQVWHFPDSNTSPSEWNPTLNKPYQPWPCSILSSFLTPAPQQGLKGTFFPLRLRYSWQPSSFLGWGTGLLLAQGGFSFPSHGQPLQPIKPFEVQIFIQFWGHTPANSLPFSCTPSPCPLPPALQKVVVKVTFQRLPTPSTPGWHWGSSFERQGECQQPSLTFSLESPVFEFSSTGDFCTQGLYCPPLTSTLRTFYTPWSQQILKKLILLLLQLQTGWYSSNYDFTINIRATPPPATLLHPKLPKAFVQVCPALLQSVRSWSHGAQHLHGWTQGPCCPLPKKGNESVVWRFLILTLMRVWFDTDLTGIVYSLFKVWIAV